MSNWIAGEIAKVKTFFEGETAKLKSEVKALEARLAAVEGVLTKPKDHP